MVANAYDHRAEVTWPGPHRMSNNGLKSAYRRLFNYWNYLVCDTSGLMSLGQAPSSSDGWKYLICRILMLC